MYTFVSSLVHSDTEICPCCLYQLLSFYCWVFNILCKCDILLNYLPVSGHFGFQFLTMNKAGKYLCTDLSVYLCFHFSCILTIHHFSHMYFQTSVCLYLKCIWARHGGECFNPALRGRSRCISEFESSLVYRVSSRTVRATQRDSVSKKQTNKNRYIM